MEVLVPLNNIEHLRDYVESGAGEFYLGFYDQAWHDRFGEYADINRLTGFKQVANLYSFEELLDMITKHKKEDYKLYITFNSSMYSEQQLDYLYGYLVRLKEVDCDGVIVSCVELLKMAAKVGLFCVISTIAGVYNCDIASFYIRHGANRIILPRDLSVQEIETVVKECPEVEYEVFMMRNGCAFSDSNCLGFHRRELNAVCSALCNAENDLKLNQDNFQTRHDAEWNNQLFREQFHNVTCGVCAIYRFVRLGITAGKIVGRSDDWENVCNDIKLIHQNVEIAKTCHSNEEYLERMIFPNGRLQVCKKGLSCYYPEIRFH